MYLILDQISCPPAPRLYHHLLFCKECKIVRSLIPSSWNSVASYHYAYFTIETDLTRPTNGGESISKRPSGSDSPLPRLRNLLWLRTQDQCPVCWNLRCNSHLSTVPVCFCKASGPCRQEYIIAAVCFVITADSVRAWPFAHMKLVKAQSHDEASWTASKGPTQPGQSQTVSLVSLLLEDNLPLSNPFEPWHSFDWCPAKQNLDLSWPLWHVVSSLRLSQYIIIQEYIDRISNMSTCPISSNYSGWARNSRTICVSYVLNSIDYCKCSLNWCRGVVFETTVT